MVVVAIVTAVIMYAVIRVVKHKPVMRGDDDQGRSQNNAELDQDSSHVYEPVGVRACNRDYVDFQPSSDHETMPEYL